MVKRYYAVKVGLKPGVYTSWDECKKYVLGHPGALYKSFNTESDAWAFVNDKSRSPFRNQEDEQDAGKATKRRKRQSENTAEENLDFIKSGMPYAFVDGSYNSDTNVYGYGGFIFHNGEKHIITGSGTDSEMASMRNVAGEVLGSMAAVQRAIELGIKELYVCYDYLGIELWASGVWKRNKKGTIDYYNYMQSIKDVINIRFVKVKGHSGVEGNEEADLLAKKAVGV